MKEMADVIEKACNTKIYTVNLKCSCVKCVLKFFNPNKSYRVRRGEEQLILRQRYAPKTVKWFFKRSFLLVM